jgi:hypothetical protein
MTKKPAILILTAILLLQFTKSALASGFSLNSIGSLDTSGRQYNHWWYSDLQPTLSGTALAGSLIDITINSQTAQTTADSGGNWSWTPSSPLNSGDNTVTLTNNQSIISFVLTLGQENFSTMPESSTSSSQGIPSVGFILPTLCLLGTGTGLLILSKKALV